MRCPDEQTTAHYLGPSYGHGPILDLEILVLAVFESTPTWPSGKLAAGAFPTKRLKSGDFSLARLLHTSRTTLEEKVVVPREPLEGTCRGGSIASAEKLRKLHRVYEGFGPSCGLRSVCVLDIVTDQDFEGHCGLRYCQKHSALSDKQKAKVRDFIAKDLADVFSHVQSFEQIYADA